MRVQDGWALRVQGRRLVMRVDEAQGWLLLAASAGHALNLAGEWDGNAFTALSAWRDDAAPLSWMRNT